MSTVNTPISDDVISDYYSDDVIWACYEQSDRTEGRGPMTQMNATYRTEQEAWDSVNHLPGVQGNRPENITWKSRKATSWQDFKAIDGLCGDYDVRPIWRINPEFTLGTLRLKS